MPLGRRVLATLERPWLVWTVAAVFGLRDALLWLLPHDRPDARNVIDAGRLYLSAPGHLYDRAIHALVTTGTIPGPGAGLLYPPVAAAMGAAFAWLPEGWAVALWTAADLAALAAALVLLDRRLGLRGTPRALYWLLAAYFPPLFAEVDAGQIGGFVLLAGVGAALLTGRRAGAAGALAGLAAAVKVYPAAMVLTAGRGRWARFFGGLAVTAAAVSLVTFVPLGLPAAPYRYLTAVLLPATRGAFADCAIDSVSTLYGRVLGGSPYAVIGADGRLVWTHLPLHLPQLASGLTGLTVAALLAAAVWAAWRSGWHALYGPLLGLSLGAVVPTEVNPYQFLPLLPVVLLVAVAALAARRGWVLLGLGLCLLCFIRQPCYLPFPNLWTLGGLGLFAICAWQNGLFAGRPLAGGLGWR